MRAPEVINLNFRAVSPSKLAACRTSKQTVDIGLTECFRSHRYAWMRSLLDNELREVESPDTTFPESGLYHRLQLVLELITFCDVSELLDGLRAE